jgi:hypothetical protein
MQAEQTANSIFGAPIYSHTRAQAIDDGILVDVTQTAHEAGFKLPVAMTSAAWVDTVKWTAIDNKRQTQQDESGRLWDVLWVAYLAARHSGNSSKIKFQLLRVPCGEKGMRPRLTTLQMQIGPGDNGGAVITLMQPGED